MTDDIQGRDRTTLPVTARHLAGVGASAVAVWLVLWALAGLPGVRGPWVASLAVEMAEAALVVAGVVGVVALVVTRWRVSARAVEDARSGEVFARSVEQLGHDRAAVRLGGLYALDQLGRRDVEYRQLVVDVWCAYLRAPVEVDEAPEKAIAPMGADAGGSGASGVPVFPAGEREVRLSAQRLIAERLRGGDALDVDLTGAVLLYPDFDGCRFGRGVFTGATMLGGAGFSGAVFEGEAAFSSVEGDVVRLDGARFAGTVFLWGNGAELELDDAVVGAGAPVVGEVAGWALVERAGGKVFVRDDG
ncbi:pentapeptide repeat-containing protein [Phytomonospora endophytica]|uniref:Pentapeptide repeat-containing protein n=1 Tax=Phytomonospora endophytica TaxID=714109 RepID=A0A841FP50_9ACTN|nr:pentapeptide repeat-containing protein [Phytomonospora endophytica]MBB6035332.1 hypothetical protein [Phytomonospora endophytica]GIG63918.1 hypothetical protein Pen01_02130 [Phytomonospora endophytica]